MVDKSTSSKKKSEKTYLTEEEVKVLEEKLAEWNDRPDKRSREAFVVGDVLPMIQQLNMEKYGPEHISKDKEAKTLWERRIKAIHGWFKNNKPFKNRAVFRLERKIPVRRVVAKLRATEIHELVMEDCPEVEKGSSEYPGLFQKSVSKYIRNLSADELNEMETTRKEWQENGPPRDVQLKAATKYSRRGVINAHELLDKEMGVDCITFSWFPDPVTGVVGVVGLVEYPIVFLSADNYECSHDYVASLFAKKSGTKLKTFREWNEKGYQRIVGDMMGYAEYIQQEKSNDGDGRRSEEETPMNYSNGPGMLPLLPKAVNGLKGREIAKHAKDIIRSYFQRHYSDGDAKTPWAKIAEDPTQFFDEDCYPVGFKFEDPSRMGKKVKSLLNHLRTRQETLGVNAFSFRNVWKEKKFHMSQYPDLAKQAIAAGAGVMEWGEPTSDNQLPIHLTTETLSQSPSQHPREWPTKESSSIGFIPREKFNEDRQEHFESPSQVPTHESAQLPSKEADHNELHRGYCHQRPDQLPTTVSLVPTNANQSPTNGDRCPTGDNQLPTDVLPTLNDRLPTHVPSLVSDTSSWMNIDPRLWPHANLPPDGDPFPINHGNSHRIQQYLSPMPPQINPPIFSPASTPSRSPRKRKQSQIDGVETPPQNRPKRIIVTPLRYRD